MNTERSAGGASVGGAAHPDGVRLQKVLAQAGVASRRAAEEMITAGRVAVDGKVVREMGRRVDPATAVVHVDGARIQLRDDLVYLALNKPRGILSAMSDDQLRSATRREAFAARVRTALAGREPLVEHVRVWLQFGHLA